MTQALVTIVCPLAIDRIAEADRLIDTLCNPARADIAAALADTGLHFASLHAVRSRDGLRGYVVLEMSADGEEEPAVRRIAGAIGDALRPVFALGRDWAANRDFADYLLANRLKVGGGWMENPGALFAGTPGMTVERIRGEAALASEITGLLGQQPPGLSALERLARVRAAVKVDPKLALCLEPAPAVPPYQKPSTIGLYAGLVGSFVATYLWPVGVALLVWALIAGLTAPHFVSGALWGLWHGFWAALAVVLLVVAVGYVLLRRAEASDWLEERTADRSTLAEMFARENRATQNHMISVTQRKPGFVRAFTLRLLFWAVGQLAARLYRPGFLSDIGSIHFARWVTPNGSPDLLFFSNFDGSWESYLEDFITLAHAGLTGIWSNSIGFPRASNLIQDGATDGERFKRYARQSMQPTRFWYTAYPRLTTAQIRANSEMRRGLSGAMTEDEATRFLALFGSAERPASKLVSSEIQSLMFGGLGFKPFGTCLLLSLPADRTEARAWLREVQPRIGFNDGRRRFEEATITLALGATGLAKLGLPAEGLSTFPYAFLEGMVTEPRARMLGDLGENASEHWWWGRAQPDVALLAYGRTQDDVDSLVGSLETIASRHGATTIHAIPLKETAAGKAEPFGFADGISQPVIRGTYKGQRNADPIHLVEAGEFILGYPDNRGNLPPGPTLPATIDPTNMLPLVTAPTGFDRSVVETPRDLGFNGSFLVIRQLEQDPEGFEAFCAGEAGRLQGRLPRPYDVTSEFIGAKMIGRWKDGSSLVRHPYQSRTDEARKTKETTRATTHPADGAVIERPVEPPQADFLFGTEDPEALRCPFGAHVRRANPRESFSPGSDEQIAISNRHRIMRVGRQYEPAPGQKPGLLFMCLNGDIERQFEFVQQSWLMSPSFHGLSCEKDPLMGDAEAGQCGFTVPSREGPVRLNPVPRFVTTRGGGYFFVPGKRLIAFLSGD